MPLSFLDLTQQMSEKSTEFAGHLKVLLKINSDLREHATKMLSEINQLVGKVVPKTCTVCYSRQGNYAVIPCGHGGLCQSCAKRSKDRGKCFGCRAEVEGYLRIFS